MGWSSPFSFGPGGHGGRPCGLLRSSVASWFSGAGRGLGWTQRAPTRGAPTGLFLLRGLLGLLRLAAGEGRVVDHAEQLVLVEQQVLLAALLDGRPRER